MADEPLIILGFGRSGTTWLADMISAVTGRYILFEPLHPSVTPHAAAWAYRRHLPDSAAEHLRAIAGKKLYRPWLLRNHIPARLENTVPALLDYLWQRAVVGGWKEIRLNFAIPWLLSQNLGRVLFITRDPYMVIGSIVNRPNFWEFGGLTNVYEMMVRNLMPVTPSFANDIEGIATMWAVTHAIALDDCASCGVPVVTYEHLENDPFGAIEHVMNVLDLERRPLHPSYLLRTSMTADVEVRPRFWRRKLTPAERDTIAAVLDRYCVRYPPLVVAATRSGS